MILDVAGAVCTSMRADHALMSTFDGRLFTDVVSGEAQGLPFAVVRSGTVNFLVEGSQLWDQAVVLVDVVGDPADVAGLLVAAGLVRSHVEKLSGKTVSGVLIQSVEDTSGAFGFDPTYTPPLPRWVLTAPMVVRSNEGALA